MKDFKNLVFILFINSLFGNENKKKIGLINVDFIVDNLIICY